MSFKLNVDVASGPFVKFTNYGALCVQYEESVHLEKTVWLLVILLYDFFDSLKNVA